MKKLVVLTLLTFIRAGGTYTDGYKVLWGGKSGICKEYKSKLNPSDAEDNIDTIKGCATACTADTKCKHFWTITYDPTGQMSGSCVLIKDITACEFDSFPSFIPVSLLANVYYKTPVTKYNDLVGEPDLVADQKNTCNDGNAINPNRHATVGTNIIEAATLH
jgi:hypothetical protein